MRTRTRLSRTVTFILVAMLAGAIALACASCGSSGAKEFSKDVQEKLSKAVDAKMAEYGVPGAIVYAGVEGEGEWLALKGKADIETGRAPKEDDLVRIASITKTFTATVILQLVDEKKLSLDDTIDKFDLGLAVPNADRITVRNLLSMNSGLFNYTEDDSFWARFLAEPTKQWTPEQLVGISSSHGPVADPGQGYQYNNTNYILLGMMIEKLTGKPAASQIKTRIIDKLKLENTSLPVSAEMPGAHMNGYMPEADETAGPAVTDITVESPSPFWTAGGIVSNLADVKTWLKALGNGDLVSSEMHEEQLKFAPPNTTSYGLGVMNGGILIGHSGEIPGYNSAAYTKPAEPTATIIVFLNRYPSKVEGVSDQFLLEVAKVLQPLFKK